MPPLPRPRSAHLPQNDESSIDKTQSSNSSLSQSRLRRLQQKTTSTLHNEISEPSTPLRHRSNDDDDDETAVNNSFIARIRENDTLARYKRELPTSNARQRRREEHRSHPTITLKEEEEEHNTPPSTPPIYDRSISNDSQIDAIEQERKANRDMKDFLNELDATLRLPAICSTSTEHSLMCDRTVVSTSNLEERRNALKDACLKEISPDELDQVLELLDHVSDAEIKTKMIDILGEDIYEKYSAQIYSLKYYENSIYTRQ